MPAIIFKWGKKRFVKRENSNHYLGMDYILWSEKVFIWHTAYSNY